MVVIYHTLPDCCCQHLMTGFPSVAYIGISSEQESPSNNNLSHTHIDRWLLTHFYIDRLSDILPVYRLGRVVIWYTKYVCKHSGK